MREYLKGELVINFWANGKRPFNELSNLTHIPDGIEINGIKYASIEHAFQSLKYIEEQRSRFSVDGDLGGWDGLRLVVKPSEFDKKYKFWSKKNNIGIGAKIATNKKIGEKLGLIRDANFKSTDELWIKILKKKYSIDYFSNLLKSTGDIYLLEFDRHAKNRDSFWGD